MSHVYPMLMTLRNHHGGFFTKAPGRVYVDGKVNYVDLVDKDLFSMHELDGKQW